MTERAFQDLPRKEHLQYLVPNCGRRICREQLSIETKRKLFADAKAYGLQDGILVSALQTDSTRNSFIMIVYNCK
ncbi:hypothetical protein JTE90_029373 [Oedothorax gibbosus]|uniref:Uncharacterized protein n=1 Tax=Oedothorax gibbosus TaxID=931172 RepID=A0AAV6VPI2_9ARAC|nr:hypothetical protein JTE90_029373 [Oedothorax gibbosus]